MAIRTSSQKFWVRKAWGLWSVGLGMEDLNNQPTLNSSLLAAATRWDGPGSPLSTSSRNAALGGPPTHTSPCSFLPPSQGCPSLVPITLPKPSVAPFPPPSPHLTSPGLGSIPFPPSAHAPPDSEGCERIGLRPRGGAAPASRSCSDAAVAALRSPAGTRASSAEHSLAGPTESQPIPLGASLERRARGS